MRAYYFCSEYTFAFPRLLLLYKLLTFSYHRKHLIIFLRRISLASAMLSSFNSRCVRFQSTHHSLTFGQTRTHHLFQNQS